MISIFLRIFYNSLTASTLRKPQNLALFCEEKIFCAENRPSRATFVVNVSNCKQVGVWWQKSDALSGVGAETFRKEKGKSFFFHAIDWHILRYNINIINDQSLCTNQKRLSHCFCWQQST